MPTIAGCKQCSWSPETDDEQPFQEHMEAKGYAVEHAEETGHKQVWIKDISET